MGIYINNKVVNKIKEEKEIKDTIESLGSELVSKKLKNMEKDMLIDILGEQVAEMKIQIIMGGI